jgi:DNA segregation ATPase FtsK/SpoIIIE, S-DNA-T family
VQAHLVHVLVHALLVLAVLVVLAAIAAFVLRRPLVILRFFWGLLLLAVADSATRRNWPGSVWAWIRWRWLTRNLGLAHVDPHAKIKVRGAIGPSIGRNVRIEKPKAKILYPKVVIRPDAYGFVAKVKTVPRVGRTEFEDAADYIANAWRCVRVQVSQPRPGRLIVRGLRVDPLADQFGIEDAPAHVYRLDAPPLPQFPPIDDAPHFTGEIA